MRVSGANNGVRSLRSLTGGADAVGRFGMSTPELAVAISSLRERCLEERTLFQQAHSGEINEYQGAIRNSMSDALARLRNDMAELSGGNEICERLVIAAGEYLEWLQWTFWDLPHIALCLRLTDDRVREVVSTCGLAYLSLRIFDDLIDRHYVYKNRHVTLLSALNEKPATQRAAEGLTILAGLLVCFEGLGRLAATDGNSHSILAHTLVSLRRATVGAIMELSASTEWTEAFYDRMTRLKNVDFWKVLYSGLDPDSTSPLYPFLERYYLLAQLLNDVQDFADDVRRGQPNLVTLLLSKNGSNNEAAEARCKSVPVGVQERIGREFLALAAMTENLPQLERSVAMQKLGESLDESFRLGVFDGTPSTSDEEADQISRLGLRWFATLEEIVQKAGSSALTDTNCALCGSTARKRLFEKQGFSFYRCADCSHVYVSPYVSGELSWQMAQEADIHDHSSGLMSVQKIFAAPICHLLRSRAPGPRLLDIGFGQGWILRLARSYGFEPYGTESSPMLVENLRSQLGSHVHLVKHGEKGLPWDGFDAVVISHVLEHLEHPDQLLGEVFRAMNPEGILYIAVPDIDSVHFQVFGKKWEAISPITHLQYFNESTLRRLLKRALFDDIERISHAPIGEEFAPRWMRLLRQIGGTDAGELSFVCRRPAL
jgi:2-polyprenyl-3-methyl-5-hydroxy-6-metoxy-1,4-benzoquinol methylase